MHDQSTRPLLDEDALRALRRTRPWLYLLGVLSWITAAFALVVMLAGIIGFHANADQSSQLVQAAIVMLLISVPTAITQIGYATALSRVEGAKPDTLPEAVETACVRQRYAWIANAFTVAVLIVATLLQMIFHTSALY